jgi:hypothetical protein
VSELMNRTEIEMIVGMSRHATEHYARAVSAERTVYVLHSYRCLNGGRDLRECPYSLALDEGIDPAEWREDVSCAIGITGGRLIFLWPVAWCEQCQACQPADVSPPLGSHTHRSHGG